MNSTLENNIYTFLRENIEQTKTLKKILDTQDIVEVKKDFVYQTEKGSFVCFVNNIFLDNEYIKQKIEKLNNEISEGTVIEVTQFLFDRKKENVLIVIAMSEIVKKEIIDKLYKIIF